MKEIKSSYNPLLTLDCMITKHENKYFDRKSAKVKPSDLSSLVSAFANADGGTIVIGISDKTKELKGDDLRNLEYAKSTRHYEDEINRDATVDDFN